MKAIVIDGYGRIDWLRPGERPDPVPGPGEILINVRAASVNPVDWKIRKGELRLVLWLRFPYIPGGDVAGEVAAVGPGVTRFQPGDPVVAFVDLKRGGGYAERAVFKESAAAARAVSLSFAEAACLPIAGCTALQALRDHGRLRQGGSARSTAAPAAWATSPCRSARRWARPWPRPAARRTSSASGRSAPTGSSITRVRTSRAAPSVTTSSSTRSAGAHSPHAGDCSIRAGPTSRRFPRPGTLFWGAVQSAAGLFVRARRAKFMWVRQEGSDLAFLGRLADDGRLKPVIAQTFPLERAREAHALSEQGHVRGKIVLEVGILTEALRSQPDKNQRSVAIVCPETVARLLRLWSREAQRFRLPADANASRDAEPEACPPRKPLWWHLGDARFCRCGCCPSTRNTHSTFGGLIIASGGSQVRVLPNASGHPSAFTIRRSEVRPIPRRRAISEWLGCSALRTFAAL